MKKPLLTLILSAALLGLAACGEAPEQAPVLEGTCVSTISAGPEGVAAILEDGSLVCRGTVPGLAAGSTDDAGFVPVPDAPEGLTYIECRQFGALAVDADGVLYGWGTVDDRGAPEGSAEGPGGSLRLMDDVYMASGFGTWYTALRRDGSVCVWGNYNGEELTEPAALLEGAVYSTPGASILADGSLWFWGKLYARDGSVTASFDEPVMAMENAVSMSGAYAIDDGGTLHLLEWDGSGIRGTELMEGVAKVMSLDYYTDSGYAVITQDGDLQLHCDGQEPAVLLEGAVCMANGEFSLYALDSQGGLWETDKASLETKLILSGVKLPESL